MSTLAVLVGGVLMAETAFFSTLAPLLSHYKLELHISTGTAGVLTGSYAVGHIVGSLPASWLTMRIGDRPTIILGLVALGAGSLVFGFGEQIVVLEVSRFAQGVAGASVWTGAWAWLIRLAPPQRRGDLVGKVLMGGIVGVLLGPLIGTAAASLGTRAVFGTLAGLTLLLAAGTMAVSSEEPPGSPTALVRPLLAGLRRSQVRTGIWLLVLPGLASSTLAVLVPLRLSHLGAGSVVVGTTFLAGAALQGLVTLITGRTADRRGRFAPLRAGLAATSCSLPLFALMTTSLSVAVLTAIVVGITGTFWGPANLVITEAMEGDGLAHGASFSVNNIAWATGQGFGPVVGATLAQATSDDVVWFALGILSAATLTWLTFRLRGRSVLAPTR